MGNTGGLDGDGTITSSSVINMAATIGATASAIALPGATHANGGSFIPMGAVTSYFASNYAATKGGRPTLIH